LPEFGLAIWLELSPSINMLRLQADAALEKVGFIPANYYSSSEHQVSAIRLGYAHLNEAEMRLGIQRLKTALMSQKSQLLRA
jgi:GntR family transcriptional regulator/MocR family aminotransferase